APSSARAAARSARSRGPSGQRSVKREQARTRQRAAFELAMVDAVAEKGYRSATAADLTARTGTSRKTFYQHFANKQECFLSAYDQVSARAVRRMERAYREAD